MAFRARIRGAVGRAAGTRWPGGRPRTTGRIAERVARRIDGKVVVDGLTLALRPGETAGLLGPDGSGRSTLLRLLAGVLAPAAGVVTPGVAPCPDILGLYVFTPPRRAR
ncbi:ATP-binding cassette domain-containing protein [Streptomyces sp. NPDC013157]|uniref:ATP-binding cassette domain-containing protein n=1 Tax=Streptomyces sp. NPDC013157 TaxID=3364861 RepID=UPI0036BB9FBC